MLFLLEGREKKERKNILNYSKLVCWSPSLLASFKQQLGELGFNLLIFFQQGFSLLVNISRCFIIDNATQGRLWRKRSISILVEPLIQSGEVMQWKAADKEKFISDTITRRG